MIVPYLGPDEGWIDALNAIGTLDIQPLGALGVPERAAAKVAILGGPSGEGLDALPNLSWVQGLWAGVDALLPVTQPRGIGLVRMQDPQMAQTMAEAALLAALMLLRDVPHYARAQRARNWAPRPLALPQERRVGIIGMGQLGQQAARKLADNGFRVAGWSRTPKTLDGVESLSGADGLDEILGRSDILLLLIPLTDATRGMLDRARLAQLPHGAAVINFARGPVIETDALLAALDEGHLSEAVLDVFDTEPLPESHPFWDHPRVTVWPHISAPTHQASASRIAVENITRWMKTGERPPVVDPARGY